MRKSRLIPWWLMRLRIRLQCRRLRFDPWVGKIPWRREWKPTPVFFSGESQGQRSLDWVTTTFNLLKCNSLNWNSFWHSDPLSKLTPNKSLKHKNILYSLWELRSNPFTFLYKSAVIGRLLFPSVSTCAVFLILTHTTAKYQSTCFDLNSLLTYSNIFWTYYEPGIMLGTGTIHMSKLQPLLRGG